MNERGVRRGAGAPFYAPPRRKTSAEIINEARAAIFGDMSGTTSEGGSVGGALRPLRTRRPFTPREPHRTLFTDRTRKKDNRPPSSFDLKYLTLSETNEEETQMTFTQNVDDLDEDTLNGLLGESQNARKKSMLRNQPKSVQERSGDGWSGFPKLPHLTGKSKPLHRRNTTSQSSIEESDLSFAISVTRPLGGADGDGTTKNRMEVNTKSLGPDTNTRPKLISTKSSSQDGVPAGALGNIAVKHLAVQMPTTSSDNFDNMSLLELSEALSNRGCGTSRTLALIEAVQKLVDINVPATSLRELVLRSLYTHIDSEDEQVLVAIARAMLTMRVTGSHLAAACKLVFKIAKNDNNDHFFHDTNLLELCVEGWGRAEPVREAECCVYGAGALRVLSLVPTLATRALRAGALHLAALHLKILNNAKSESPRSLSEQSTHALFQVTGAMRNLAAADEREFVPSGALAELLAALLLHTDRDVLTNVARCLSVLSAECSCCGWLCSAPHSARALLRALAACAARPPLAVRLAYTLGNMAAADERARINIYDEEGSIDVLLTILESYTTRHQTDVRDFDDPDLHLVETDLCGSDGSNEDVLIKTVRIIANLCLTERAGRGLATTYIERITKALLACLKLAEDKRPDAEDDDIKVHQVFEKYEELSTAALATLNNITFYSEPPDAPDPLYNTLENICKVTCARLGRDAASSCEAVRALGNLSRDARAAQLIVLHGALELLPPYLNHEESSVRCAAAGVLVNVCGSGAEVARAGVEAARALRVAARVRDVRSAALLARALWNAHAHAPLQAEHASTAAIALNSFLDDESMFAACEASRAGNRRASDPAIFKHHVKFDTDNNNYEMDERVYTKSFYRAISVDQDLHLEESDVLSGEDLGFEEGDLEEECECEPCRRLAAWEELVGVAVPLLEKLKPSKADASVGTD
ncbi:armadillo repeat-containing protein 2 [Bombyx mandarina]|uniref:Armadillo repeat-containing protein 2 n=1 Tax=Bombyx mandarina TaxID=7092 RepID=A0A6J2K889_BOMMA|nr:armadillo repeat-containing protein 2 [Bombyx mandarina]